MNPGPQKNYFALQRLQINHPRLAIDNSVTQFLFIVTQPRAIIAELLFGYHGRLAKFASKFNQAQQANTYSSRSQEEKAEVLGVDHVDC